jgi:hypothetical protein
VNTTDILAVITMHLTDMMSHLHSEQTYIHIGVVMIENFACSCSFSEGLSFLTVVMRCMIQQHSRILYREDNFQKPHLEVHS